MASPDVPAPTNNEVAVIARPKPTAQFFFPNSPSLYYFSAPPPIYLISENNLLPPPSIWVYYPLWYIHPNPSRYEFRQELPPLYPPNPSQELTLSQPSSTRVFRRRSYGRGTKVTWRRRIKPEVKSSGDHITTVMLRNIPSRYTREMMIDYMDKHCEEANSNQKDEKFPNSAYDFLYLPIDFKTKLNKGYAFVNFTNAKAVPKFKAACNYKPWCHFYSKKQLEITSARIQGKDELVRRFLHMTYPAEAYSAICFSPARSGGNNTVQTTMVGKCTEPMSSV